MEHQKATTEKPIVAIESKNQEPFVGFENLIRPCFREGGGIRPWTGLHPGGPSGPGGAAAALFQRGAPQVRRGAVRRAQHRALLPPLYSEQNTADSSNKPSCCISE